MKLRNSFSLGRFVSKTSWLVAVPVLLLVAGCNAQTPGEAAPETEPVTETTETATETAENTPDAAETDEGDPDPSYKVVPEGRPGLPEEAASALEKVVVPPPPLSMKVPKKAVVRITTSKGPVTVELNGEEAPLHVKSFLYLTKLGFYDATILHRYEPGFVIQGGDPLTKNPALKNYAGIGGPGYQVPREENSLTHEQFVFAAARSQDPNSAGSQFYITLQATPNLDQGDGYTVYGKVTEGQDTVLKLRGGDKLEKVEIISEQ